MNTAFFIARRYFFSKKKTNFINVISIMSMAGVAIGTMLLVIVLSVFNGLEDLIRSLYNTFDAEIKVSVVKGKTFEVDSVFLKKIYSVQGVDVVTEVIEDWAHLQYGDDEKLVKVKGVSLNFVEHRRMDSIIVDGKLELQETKKRKEKIKGRDTIVELQRNFAIVGRGIAHQLNISIYDQLGFLELSYPVKKEGAASKNELKNYERKQVFIKPGAIFAIEKQYDDNYLFVPLNVAKDLMNYQNRRTALEIKTKKGFVIDDVRDQLRQVLGNNFEVLNSDEQHSSLLKAIKIEKLFVYITFSFILVIASLNILFSLTMLAIEKKKDVAILFSLGASRKFIKKLFLIEGFIIALTGAILGLTLGVLVCWLQQIFGFVSMGMETSIVDAYPVKMQFLDFLFTGLTILVITFAISYRPAIKASRFDLRENLK